MRESTICRQCLYARIHAHAWRQHATARGRVSGQCVVWLPAADGTHYSHARASECGGHGWRRDRGWHSSKNGGSGCVQTPLRPAMITVCEERQHLPLVDGVNALLIFEQGQPVLAERTHTHTQTDGRTDGRTDARARTHAHVHAHANTHARELGYQRTHEHHGAPPSSHTHHHHPPSLVVSWASQHQINAERSGVGTCGPGVNHHPPPFFISPAARPGKPACQLLCRPHPHRLPSSHEAFRNEDGKAYHARTSRTRSASACCRRTPWCKGGVGAKAVPDTAWCRAGEVRVKGAPKIHLLMERIPSTSERGAARRGPARPGSGSGATSTRRAGGGRQGRHATRVRKAKRAEKDKNERKIVNW